LKSFSAFATQTIGEAFLHNFGNEAADIPAETGDFFDQTGADEDVGVLGHHEDGLDAFVEFAIHERELELELEVGDGAKAADDGVAVDALDIFDEEAGEGIDRDVGKVRDGLGAEFLALRHGEERAFAFVLGDGDDDLVEEFGGALDDIEMAIGDGIETPGINRRPHRATVSGAAAGA
jgi:hypothetical protein